MYTVEEKSRVLRVYGFNSISIKMFPVPESRKQANFIIITRRGGGEDRLNLAIGITPRPRRYDKLPQFEFRPIADITSLINQIRRLQVQLCSDAGLIWEGRRRREREGDTRNLCDPWRTIEAKVLGVAPKNGKEGRRRTSGKIKGFDWIRLEMKSNRMYNEFI